MDRHAREGSATTEPAASTASLPDAETLVPLTKQAGLRHLHTHRVPDSPSFWHDICLVGADLQQRILLVDLDVRHVYGLAVATLRLLLVSDRRITSHTGVS